MYRCYGLKCSQLWAEGFRAFETGILTKPRSFEVCGGRLRGFQTTAWVPSLQIRFLRLNALNVLIMDVGFRT